MTSKRAADLRKTPLATQPRICLRCEREFNSTGPGNRICSRCWPRRVDDLPAVPTGYPRVMRARGGS